MASQEEIPHAKEMFCPTLQALRMLGGKGSIKAIRAKVAEILQLSDKQLSVMHVSQSNVMTEFVYRLGWTLTYLKNAGNVENVGYGMWQLTEEGWRNEPVGSEYVRKQTVAVQDDKSKSRLPSWEAMVNPALAALRDMGGTARKADISNSVAATLQLQEDLLGLTYESGSSMFGNVVNDVRVFLLKQNFIHHPRRGYWQLTKQGWDAEPINVEDLKRRPVRSRHQDQTRRSQPKHAMQSPESSAGAIPLDDFIEGYASWRDELNTIMQQLTPSAFERFFMRIFRSEGIDTVETVNSTGDGSIDGTMVSSGFLSFRVAFKFVGGNRMISAQEVDDFRRSMRASNADKGLLITTGSFTQEALRDAGRGQSPAVELIDGEQFLNKLKERSLGIDTEQVLVERVVVNRQFFNSL